MRKQLTHLSLVKDSWQSCQTIFSMRHKASHAEVGDRQDSGSQLANRQDLGRIHCRTVGHTQNLPVEEYITTWTFSNKVLITSRQKTS